MEQLSTFVRTNKQIRKGIVDENREINDLLEKLNQLK